MGKLGVKETKDVVVAIARFGTAAGKALEDGKVGIMDFPLFFAPVSALSDAVQGADQIPSEIADLDNTELDDLEKTFMAEFQIPETEVEDVVDAAVSLADQAVKFFLRFRKPAA